jgi:cytosine/adenosine deaminase-related metal-dependent hydrolase
VNETMIVGARIWDGSGSTPLDGDVLIEGNRIRVVSRVPGQLSQAGCQVIDAKGMTLMPGLVEGEASAKHGLTLGNYQEIRVRHFEKAVDKYLAMAPHRPDRESP